MAATTFYFIYVFIYVQLVTGDYQCVCNYNIETAVMPAKSRQGTPLGYMYEFDCKKNIQSLNTDQWWAVAFKHKVGYVEVGSQAQQQICSGQPAQEDKVTTPATPTMSSTTPSITSPSTMPPTTRPSTATSMTSSTIPLPTTQVASTFPTTQAASTLPKTQAASTSSTTQAASTMTTTQAASTLTTTQAASTSTTTQIQASSTTSNSRKSSTPSSITLSTTTLSSTTSFKAPNAPGDISHCPTTLRVQTQRDGAVLGYFRGSCYELLPGRVNHEHAYQLCKSRGGNMVDILNSLEQAYVQAFLKLYSPRNAVWTGLNDKRTEGTFEWTSGAVVSYTNWLPNHTDNFLSHDEEDCVLMIPYKDGQWDDTPCGFSGIFGDLGESHLPLCEYKLSSGNTFIG